MKVRVYAPHRPEPERLPEVVDAMHRLGPPTVPVFFNGRDYEALDGSHRLAAAAESDLPVRFVRLGAKDVIGEEFDNAGRVVGHVLHFLRQSSRPEVYVEELER